MDSTLSVTRGKRIARPALCFAIFDSSHPLFTNRYSFFRPIKDESLSRACLPQDLNPGPSAPRDARGVRPNPFGHTDRFQPIKVGLKCGPYIHFRFSWEMINGAQTNVSNSVKLVSKVK